MARYLDYEGLSHFWQKVKDKFDTFPGLETDESIYTLFETKVEDGVVKFGDDCASVEDTTMNVEGAVVNDTLIIS